MERKAYTDDEINALIAKRAGPLKERVRELEQQNADYERVKVELTKAAEGLQSQLNAITAERDTTRTELQGAKQRIAHEITAHRTTRAGHTVTQALLAAGLLPIAAEPAVETFMRTASFKFDDAGELEHVTTADGVEHKPSELNKAAEYFLRTQPWFAKANQGGSGTRLPAHTHSAMPSSIDLTPGQLMSEGLRRPE